MSNLEIILVRHTESSANVGEVITHRHGDHHISLTTNGILQAMDLKDQLSAEWIADALVYCSPYQRTIQTLDVLLNAHHLYNIPVRQNPLLREHDRGYQSEKSQLELRRTHGWFGYRHAGGESPADVYQRMCVFLETMYRDIAQTGKRKVLIVTHGMTLRCFAMRFLNLPVADFERLDNPRNGAIVRIGAIDQIRPPRFTRRRWAVSGLQLRSPQQKSPRKSSMKLALFSDLHLEFGEERPPVPKDADVIILAGDIHKGLKTIETAHRYQQDTQKPVIVIAGNHEFYGADHPTLLGQLRQEAEALESVHFLENKTVIIGKTRFIGCTLWTNFSLHGSRHKKKMMREADWAITDYRRIGFNGKPMEPEDAYALFQESYAWLESELAKPFDGTTVVITHFAPHRAAIHPYYGNGDKITPYFVPDCAELFHKYKINLWLYGHTHNSVDTIVANGTRLISNQGGYPREDSNYVQFDPDKLIEI